MLLILIFDGVTVRTGNSCIQLTYFGPAAGLGEGVGRGGATPLYKSYRYVPPHRVGFLRRFGLKADIQFSHFGLESGMVFGGTTGVYEHFYRFNSK